jgi:hypothetical protein
VYSGDGSCPPESAQESSNEALEKQWILGEKRRLLSREKQIAEE